jgi:hypothetical protein
MVQPQSMKWPGKRAVLLVHGVGNAAVGDYSDLARQIETLLGGSASQFAIYVLYYDQINDWFATKQRMAVQVTTLLQSLRGKLASLNMGAQDPVSLGNAIAEIVGDVIWPVLLADARNAVRTALIDQLVQIVTDGDDAGTPPRDQHLSIIAHSMGCFHVYEALHTIAADRTQAIGPASGGVQFANVIYMASPVQLIRTVAGLLGPLVPQQESMRSVSQPLALPAQASATTSVQVSRKTVSICGDLDPVSGYFFRKNPDWSFLNFPGLELSTDKQQLAQINGSDEISLTKILESALSEQSAPVIQPNNPHDWSAYVDRHKAELLTWLTSDA